MQQMCNRLRKTTNDYIGACRTVSQGRQTRKELQQYASLYTAFWKN